MDKIKDQTIKIINFFSLVFILVYYLTIYFDFSGSLIFAINCDEIYHRIFWIIIVLCIFNIILFIVKNIKNIKDIKNSPNKYLSGLMLNKEYLLLIALFIWTLISILGNCIITGKSLWSANAEPIYEMLFAVFIFFPLGYYYSKEKIKKIVIYIIHICMIFLISIGSYIFYKMLNLEIITTSFGGKIRMGDGFRLMINSNPNFTGLYMLAFTMISLLFSLIYKNIFRYIYIYGSFIFFMLLSLSGCRSAFVGFIISICFFIFLIPFKLKKSFDKKIILSVLGTIFGFVIVYFLRKLPFFLIKIINGIDNKSRDLNITYSSGRLQIWMYTLKGFVKSLKNILFGRTPGCVMDFVWEMSKETFYGYTHNQFIEILVAIGSIGLLIYIIWIFYIAKKCFNICFLMKNISLYHLFIPCIILSYVIANMFEAHLLYKQFIIGNMFILLCGFVSGFNENTK